MEEGTPTKEKKSIGRCSWRNGIYDNVRIAADELGAENGSRVGAGSSGKRGRGSYFRVTVVDRWLHWIWVLQIAREITCRGFWASWSSPVSIIRDEIAMIACCFIAHIASMYIASCVMVVSLESVSPTFMTSVSISLDYNSSSLRSR